MNYTRDQITTTVMFLRILAKEIPDTLVKVATSNAADLLESLGSSQETSIDALKREAFIAGFNACKALKFEKLRESP